MQTKIIKVGVLALSLAMLGGCGNMKQMQADIDAANTAASAAMSKATEAYNLASKGDWSVLNVKYFSDWWRGLYWFYNGKAYN